MENKKLRTPLLDNYSSQLNQNKMTATKMYKIELKSIGGIANDLATNAALSNGGKYISLLEMEAIARVECIKFPVTTAGITINPIGNNVLTIDRGTENLLVLTEVEVMELDCPTLTRNEAKEILDGIANPDNLELLN